VDIQVARRIEHYIEVSCLLIKNKIFKEGSNMRVKRAIIQNIKLPSEFIKAIDY
jgi:hypothetical protein